MKIVLVLLCWSFLGQLTLETDTKLLHQCDISVYDEALAAQQEFMEIIEDVGAEVSEKCMFHPDNNIFQPLNKNFRLKRSRYRCKLCSENGQSTAEEIYQHLIDAHPEIFSDKMATVCLSDYCDLLACPSRIPQLIADRESSRCSSRVMQQRRFECYRVIKQCFPGDSALSLELIQQFEQMYCDKFSCLHDGGDYVDITATETRLVERTTWWVKLSAFVVISLFICIFYIAVYLWRSETATRNDLRSLNKTKSSWFGKKSNKKLN